MSPPAPPPILAPSAAAIFLPPSEMVRPLGSSNDNDSSASSSTSSPPPTPPSAPHAARACTGAAAAFPAKWRPSQLATALPREALERLHPALLAQTPLAEMRDGTGGAAEAEERERAEEREMGAQPLSSLVCPYDDEMHFAADVDVDGWTTKDLLDSQDVYSRDFAELSTTIRVLSLALDPSTPLLDRFKFCTIVSSLLDEHFVQRLGAIEKTDLHDFRSSRLSLKRHIRPRTPREDKLDAAIRAVVRDQHLCLNGEVLPALKQYGVHILSHEELDTTEREKVACYFDSYVKHSLTPLVVDPTHPFPTLASHVLHLCVMLRPCDMASGGSTGGSAGSKDSFGRWEGGGGGGGSGSGSGYGLTGPVHRVFIKVPAEAKRLVPVDDSGLRFLPLEALVQAHIPDVCCGMELIAAFPFRVTRNVKMTLEDADFRDGIDLMEMVQGEIHRRRSAPPTRLEIPSDFPADVRAVLVAQLGLDDADVFVVEGGLLDLSSIMSLAFLPQLPELRQVVKEPQVPSRFRGIANALAKDPGAIFRVIRERDVLIEHPKDSFEQSTLLFLAAAARDPSVRSIKQVIYRAGSKSPLIDALVRAAKNGKEVTVLVELKASFDEVQNCEYANTLQAAGCNVMYGLAGLKVHSKLLLVVRQEEDGTVESYCCIATGNFNAKTAKLYTDMSIMTCHRDLCADMHDVFNSLTGFSRVTHFRGALVAPVNMTDRFVQLMREEAANARAGRLARIVAQVNGLSDVQIIRELYDASQAGVAIDLFVRGACRLRPGLKKLSENIRVFSWVGPVLQHRRIFYCYANGEEKCFIGSADWRTRNLNDRTEVAIPVFDERIKRRLGRVLTQLNDKRYLWQLLPDNRYYKISALPQPTTISMIPVRRIPASVHHVPAALTAQSLRAVAALAPSSTSTAVRYDRQGNEVGRIGSPISNGVISVFAGGKEFSTATGTSALPVTTGLGMANGLGSADVDDGGNRQRGGPVPIRAESGSVANPGDAGGHAGKDGMLVNETGRDGEENSPERSGQRYLGSPYVGEYIEDGNNSVSSLGLPASRAGTGIDGAHSKRGANAPGEGGVGLDEVTSTAAGTGGAPALSAQGSGSTARTSGQTRTARGRPRSKRKYKVNINGNPVHVDKIAAGAVPIRYDDPADISTLRVMVVQRREADDPWSVPKGGMDESESPMHAAMRLTREKGGVTRSEHIATLGWILRPKRNKTIAVSTFMLRVLDLGGFVNSLHDRRRKWMTFSEAIELALGSGNSFTLDSLKRAYALCKEMFEKNQQELEKELATGRAESDSGDGVASEEVRAVVPPDVASDHNHPEENEDAVLEASSGKDVEEELIGNRQVDGAARGEDDIGSHKSSTRSDAGVQENDGAGSSEEGAVVHTQHSLDSTGAIDVNMPSNVAARTPSMNSGGSLVSGSASESISQVQKETGFDESR